MSPQGGEIEGQRDTGTACELSRDQVISQLEYLSAVRPGALRPLLVTLWRPGNHCQAARRIDALQKSFVRRGGQASAQQGISATQQLVEAVDELLRTRPHWRKTDAFKHMATQRGQETKSIATAYARGKKRQQQAHAPEVDTTREPSNHAGV